MFWRPHTNPFLLLYFRIEWSVYRVCVVILFYILFFKLDDNYFTILWWFLLIATWISIRPIYVPSLLNPLSTSLPIPSLSVVTEHWLWVTESYIELPLAVLHMVMCMFQFYSLIWSRPLLPTTVSKMSVSPLLPCK